ncbi:hypothetical protein ACFLTD_05220, partial [Elusimicrobiota bacterium]
MSGNRAHLAGLIIDALGYHGAGSLSVYNRYIRKNISTENSSFIYTRIIDSSVNLLDEYRSGESAEMALDNIFYSLKYPQSMVRDHALGALKRVSVNYTDIEEAYISRIEHYAYEEELLAGISRFIARELDMDLARLQGPILYLTSRNKDLQMRILAEYISKMNDTDSQVSDQAIAVFERILSGNSAIIIDGFKHLEHVEAIHPGLLNVMVYSLKNISGDQEKITQMIANFLIIKNSHIRDDVMSYLKDRGDVGRRALGALVNRNDHVAQVFVRDYSFNSGSEDGYGNIPSKGDNKRYIPAFAMSVIDFIGENKKLLDDPGIVNVLASYKDAHDEAALKALDLLAPAGDPALIAPFLGNRNSSVQVKAFEMLYPYGEAAREVIAAMLIDDAGVKYFDMNYAAKKAYSFWIAGELLENIGLADKVIRFMLASDAPYILKSLLPLRHSPYGVSIPTSRIILEYLAGKGMYKDIVDFVMDNIYKTVIDQISHTAQEETFGFIKKGGIAAKEYLVRRIKEESRYKEYVVNLHVADPKYNYYSRKDLYTSFRQDVGAEAVGFIDAAGQYSPDDIVAIVSLMAMHTHKLKERAAELLPDLYKKVPSKIIIKGLSLVSSHIPVLPAPPEGGESSGITDALSYFLLNDELSVQEQTAALLLERSKENDYSGAHVTHVLGVLRDRIVYELADNDIGSRAYRNLVHTGIGLDMLDVYKVLHDKLPFYETVGYGQYKLLILLETSEHKQVSRRAKEFLNIIEEKMPERDIRELIEKLDIRSKKHISGSDRVYLEYFAQSVHESVRSMARQLLEEYPDKPDKLTSIPAILKIPVIGAGIYALSGMFTSADAFTTDQLGELIGGPTSYDVTSAFFFNTAATVIVFMILLGVIFGSSIISKVREIYDRRSYRTSEKIRENLEDVFGEPRKSFDTDYDYIRNSSLNKNDTKSVKQFLDSWLKGETDFFMKNDEISARFISAIPPDHRKPSREDILRSLVKKTADRLKYHKILVSYLYTNDRNMEERIKKLVPKEDKQWNALVRYTLLS